MFSWSQDFGFGWGLAEHDGGDDGKDDVKRDVKRLREVKKVSRVSAASKEQVTTIEDCQGKKTCCVQRCGIEDRTCPDPCGREQALEDRG